MSLPHVRGMPGTPPTLSGGEVSAAGRGVAEFRARELTWTLVETLALEDADVIVVLGAEELHEHEESWQIQGAADTRGVATTVRPGLYDLLVSEEGLEVRLVRRVSVTERAQPSAWHWERDRAPRAARLLGEVRPGSGVVVLGPAQQIHELLDGTPLEAQEMHMRGSFLVAAGERRCPVALGEHNDELGLLLGESEIAHLRESAESGEMERPEDLEDPEDTEGME